MTALSAIPAPETSSAKPSLLGLTRAQLAEHLRGLDLPEREIRMRVNQMWNWIYFHGAPDFDRMLNISKVLRARLVDHFTLARPEVVSEQLQVGDLVADIPARSATLKGQRLDLTGPADRKSVHPDAWVGRAFAPIEIHRGVGAAEIPAFDAATKRAFVVNGAQATVEVLDLAVPTDPKRVGAINVVGLGASVNSVSIHNGLVALAIEAAEAGVSLNRHVSARLSGRA